MDSKDKLWLSRGEALGRVLSESGRAQSRRAKTRPPVDRLADPVEAARFSASIALAMRNGALRNAKDLRADAMRAGFRWLMRALKRWFTARPRTGRSGAPMVGPMATLAPIRQRARIRR